MDSLSIDVLHNYYDQHQKSLVEDYLKFLSFPSISTDPEYQEPTLACAHWVENYLAEMGFKTELWPASDHPVIYGEWMGAGLEAPTLLIYHHYDVQPVDPLELWETPPFQPTIKEGQVYARGAQDNKGQCFYTLAAVKAILHLQKALPINVKFCIEGGEECGSHGLDEILPRYAERLKADYLVIIDVGIPDQDTPSVVLGTRGLVAMDVVVTGSNIDLHSGSHGGLVFNPLRALTKLLGHLHDNNGHITIPGFYDQVQEMKEEDRQKIDFDFDQASYETFFQTEATGGELNFSPQERNWVRPTLEINGVHGGYCGTGFKTVIPAKAFAKISCRLVPDQEPAHIGALVKAYLEQNSPPGTEVKVDVHSGFGKAVRVDINSKVVQAFAKAFSEIFNRPCKYILEGASIPITPKLAEASQSETVLVGLGLLSDQIHAPNEHFGLDRLKKGFLIVARALQHLALK